MKLIAIGQPDLPRFVDSKKAEGSPYFPNYLVCGTYCDKVLLFEVTVTISKEI